MFTKSVVLLSALASSVAAHGFVQGFRTDGVWHQGYILNYYYDQKNGIEIPNLAAWSAENLDSGFVAPSNYTSPDIVCQKNGQPAPSTVQVSAGGTVEFLWNKWAHFGPVMTYVARCEDDCSKADKAALKWIKIDEAGIDVDTQEWAATAMVNNNLTWVTTVPKSLAPGNYVFRHETIAVHGSYEVGGAQNYPQCFNIEITGSGTATPEGVLATELYTPTDPGIYFNPYQKPIQNYTIPGPALFVDNVNNKPKATPVGPVTISGSSNNITPTIAPSPSTSAPLTTTTMRARLTQVVPSAGAASVLPTSVTAEPKPKPGCGKRPSKHSSHAAGKNDPKISSTAEGQNNDVDKELPGRFTLDEFIAWLKEYASGTKSRNHARDMGQNQ